MSRVGSVGQRSVVTIPLLNRIAGKDHEGTGRTWRREQKIVEMGEGRQVKGMENYWDCLRLKHFIFNAIYRIFKSNYSLGCATLVNDLENRVI